MKSISLNFKKIVPTQTSDIILLIMISCYCFLEYKFNLYLFSQMSVSTSRLAIDNVETLGRTLSGIGLSLLVVKFIYNKRKKELGLVSSSELLIGFSAALLILIPFSFFAQSYIVNFIVDSSNPADRRDAILAATVNSTFIPYYNENSNERYPVIEEYFSNKRIFENQVADIHSNSLYEESFLKKQKYYNLTQSCVSKIDNKQTRYFSSLGLIDKAFYSLKLLHASNSIRNELENHITDYYKCLINDEDSWNQIRKDLYIDTEIEETKIALADKYYDYESKSEDYYQYMKKARFKFQEKRIQEEWRNGVEETLGEGAYIKPGLNYEQFKNNKAVKNLILEKGLRFTVYDSDKEVKTKFVEGLPSIILLGYDYYMDRGNNYEKQQELIKEYGVVDCNIVRCYLDENEVEKTDFHHNFSLNKSERRKKKIQKAKIESGKQSYKAIVIPMVALVLSLFFLGTNVISIITFIISLFSKRISLIIASCLLSFYILYPYVAHKNIIQDEDHKALSTIINWASFYQKKVYNFQEKKLFQNQKIRDNSPNE